MEVKEYTTHWLDIVGNTFTVIIMLPLFITIALLVGAYWLIKLPFWWMSRKWRTINRDNKI